MKRVLIKFHSLPGQQRMGQDDISKKDIKVDSGEEEEKEINLSCKSKRP